MNLKEVGRLSTLFSLLVFSEWAHGFYWVSAFKETYVILIYVSIGLGMCLFLIAGHIFPNNYEYKKYLLKLTDEEWKEKKKMIQPSIYSSKMN